MNNALHSVQDITYRLLRIEKSSRADCDSDIRLAIYVCAKLQVPLTRFAGPVGYSTLLSRALALSCADNTRFQDMFISPDGILVISEPTSLQGQPISTNLPNDEGAILIAHLLALLATFVGEHLMLTLLSDAWPDESFDRDAPAIEVKS